MSQKIKDTLLRFVRFSATSLFGTVVDTLVLWACSSWIFHTYFGEYVISPAISFECAVLTNFTISYFYTWKDRISSKTKKSYLRHLAGYNISCLGVFLLKMVFLLTIQRLFKWDVVWCNLLALCFSGIINFLMNERVVFRRRKTSDVR